MTLPAGTDLDRLVGDRPATQRRGRLRRRLRHLRSVREILLRDLGGLVFEVHRSGDPAGTEHHDIVGAKLERMRRVDAEIRELEAFLDDHRGLVVREPGIGGTCTVCGELFGSDARFCWACGTPVAPGATRPPAVTRAIAEQLPALLPEPSEAPTVAPPYVDASSEEETLPPPPTGGPVEGAPTAPPPGLEAQPGFDVPPPPPAPPAADTHAPVEDPVAEPPAKKRRRGPRLRKSAVTDAATDDAEPVVTDNGTDLTPPPPPPPPPGDVPSRVRE